MVPPSRVFGLVLHSRNGVSGRNGRIVTEMEPNKADLHRWSKIRGPEFKGDNRWYSYIIQFSTIMKMNDCRDNDVMVCKLVEALRGGLLIILSVYLERFVVNLLHCVILFKCRFGSYDQQSTLRSSM